MKYNGRIISFRIEGEELEAYENFCNERGFNKDSVAMRYMVKMQVQVDNLIKNRPIEFAPNTITVLDKMSKLELVSFQLALIKMLGQDEVDRIQRLAARKQ